MPNYRVKYGVVFNSSPLKDLEGLPENINGDLDIGYCGLLTLKGIEKTSITHDLMMSQNPDLKEFDYLPKFIGNSLYCKNCGFEDFRSFPRVINGQLHIGDNFRSMMGFPEVKGNLVFMLTNELLKDSKSFEDTIEIRKYWVDRLRSVRSRVGREIHVVF